MNERIFEHYDQRKPIIIVCDASDDGLYIGDRKFTVRTNHKAITFFKHCYPTTDRLRRWELFMQQFDFDIEYIKGTENYLADHLSRFIGPHSNVRNRNVFGMDLE